jgi:hypothetical protein
MTKPEYAEKLLDPRWKEKRQEILTRDEFRCLDCGREPRPKEDNDEVVVLQVHHCKYIYGRDPWDYDNDTLRTLCSECHDVRHETEKEAVEALRLLMAKLRRHELYALKEGFQFRNFHTPMHGVPRNREEQDEQKALHEWFFSIEKLSHEWGKR